MADFQCHPLWEVDPDQFGDVVPDSLPIAQTLKARLAYWAATYNATLDWNDPASSGFTSSEAEAEFLAEGRLIATLLRAELGAEFNIVEHRADSAGSRRSPCNRCSPSLNPKNSFRHRPLARNHDRFVNRLRPPPRQRRPGLRLAQRSRRVPRHYPNPRVDPRRFHDPGNFPNHGVLVSIRHRRRGLMARLHSPIDPLTPAHLSYVPSSVSPS